MDNEKTEYKQLSISVNCVNADQKYCVLMETKNL